MAKPSLQSLSQLPQPLLASQPEWNLQEVSGRLVEISEPQPISALSFAFLLVREAQTVGEYAAWIGTADSIFYPPDAEKNGIDLDNLPVLRMLNTQHIGRGAEMLLRSGAFRLVILDLAKNHTMPAARLSQLNALVRKHNACALFLTQKQLIEPSLGSLVSLRAHTRRERVRDGEFLCEIRMLRDKRRGDEWRWSTHLAGVDGYY